MGRSITTCRVYNWINKDFQVANGGKSLVGIPVSCATINFGGVEAGSVIGSLVWI